MKKTILTIILSIYLTITTIASVVFGYLYFSNLSKDGFTISDAKTLAARVWSDLTDLNDTSAKASDLQVSQTALKYDDYNKDSVSFGDFTDRSDEFYGQWAKIYQTFALVNSLLSTHSSKNQLHENTLYNSTLNYHYTGSEYSGGPSKLKLKEDLFGTFYLTSNSVIASVWDIQSDNSTSGAGFGYVIELIKGEGLGWELNAATYKKEFNEQISSLTEYYVVNSTYCTAAADANGKVYKMHYSDMTLEDGSREKTENILSNDVQSFDLKEANVQTHKKLSKTKETLADDLEEQANNHMKSVGALNDKGLSFKNMTAVDSDFSQKFFDDLYGKGDFEIDV